MLRTKCLHACLHTDWSPYGTFNYSLCCLVTSSLNKETVSRMTQLEFSSGYFQLCIFQVGLFRHILNLKLNMIFITTV